MTPLTGYPTDMASALRVRVTQTTVPGLGLSIRVLPAVTGTGPVTGKAAEQPLNRADGGFWSQWRSSCSKSYHKGVIM